MRIWVINPFDDIPGEGSKQRYWTIAEKLAARGHEVVWWSSSWSHRRKTRRTLPERPDQLPAGIELRLVEAPPYHKNVSLERLKNHRFYARQLRAEGETRLSTQPPDGVLISWPPMETWEVAHSWKQQCGCRIILDVMDAWPDNFLMLAPKLPVARALLRLALSSWLKRSRRACQGSDGVSSQSEAFADWARQRGAPDDPHVCYLGAEQSVKDGAAAPSPNPSPLRLLYLGAMGRLYDLETCLQAMEILVKRGIDVRLDLAGQGEKKPALIAQSAELQRIGRVTFHGYLQGEALSSLLQTSHVGLIPMHPESLVAAPYKAGEYLAAGLPIVSSLPGELQQLLEQGQCGAPYAYGNPASLADAIQHYMDRDRLTIERRNALLLFTQKFDRSVTYEQWADWVESMAQKKPRAFARGW